MSSSSERLRALPRRIAGAARRRWRGAVRLHDTGSRAGLAVRSLPHRAEARQRAARLAARTVDVHAPTPAATPTTVIRLDHGPVAANRALAAARTPVVTLTLGTTELLDPGCEARLATALSDRVALAGPLVVHPVRRPWAATPRDATVRTRGLSLVVRDDAPVPVALGAGAEPDPTGDPEPVMAVTGALAVVDRDALLAVGGIPDFADPDVALLELSRRLAAVGRTSVVVPSAVVRDSRRVAVGTDPDAPIATTGAAWTALVRAHGPALRRWAGATGPTSFALTVAAPSARIAERWGDWHLAEALARALRARGHAARVGAVDAADAPATRAADVHVVIRGLTAVPRATGQRHVLWVISHPEQVTAAECDAADLVLVASAPFAEHLRGRTRTPVEVMLQATDPERFAPRPPDPARAHEVVVVAKSREVFRPMVADAITAGLRPAIHGSGWERFVDPKLIVTDRVDNADLAAVYCSAGVLLNDHWDTMREWGFVSNRIFDALACGTPVISDPVPGLADLFGDAVVTADDPTTLRAAVDAILADPVGARSRAARGGAIVRAEHTFAHRAEQLVDALRRHNLTAAPEPG